MCAYMAKCGLGGFFREARVGRKSKSPPHTHTHAYTNMWSFYSYLTGYDNKEQEPSIFSATSKKAFELKRRERAVAALEEAKIEYPKLVAEYKRKMDNKLNGPDDCTARVSVFVPTSAPNPQFESFIGEEGYYCTFAMHDADGVQGPDNITGYYWVHEEKNIIDI